MVVGKGRPEHELHRGVVSKNDTISGPLARKASTLSPSKMVGRLVLQVAAGLGGLSAIPASRA